MAKRKSGELAEKQAKLTDYNLIIEKYNQGLDAEDIECGHSYII